MHFARAEPTAGLSASVELAARETSILLKKVTKDERHGATHGDADACHMRSLFLSPLVLDDPAAHDPGKAWSATRRPRGQEYACKHDDDECTLRSHPTADVRRYAMACSTGYLRPCTALHQ